MSVEKLEQAMLNNKVEEFEHFLKSNKIEMKLAYNSNIHEIECVYMLDEKKLLADDVLIDMYREINSRNLSTEYMITLQNHDKIDEIYNKLFAILHGDLPDLDDHEICEVESPDSSREIEGSLEEAEIIGAKETSIREQTLDTAKKCVMGDREQDYGTPESNFATIASFWSDYLDMDISAQQVADMMILMKISRIKNGGGTGDSYVDIAGYAACGNEILSKKG